MPTFDRGHAGCQQLSWLQSRAHRVRDQCADEGVQLFAAFRQQLERTPDERRDGPPRGVQLDDSVASKDGQFVKQPSSKAPSNAWKHTAPVGCRIKVYTAP